VNFIQKTWNQINFSPLKREISFWIILGVVLLGIGKWADIEVFHLFGQYLHTPFLDIWVPILTEKILYVILGLFAVVTGVRVWRNPDHHSKLVPALFALLATGIITAIFKSFFDVPRPFRVLDLTALVEVSLNSFPSGHTSAAFALLVPLWRISKRIGVLWFLFAILVGYARIYENVHYASDIAGGILVGGLMGAIFSHPVTEKAITTLWKDLEFRRQSFHFIAGFLCVFVHWIGVLRLREIGGLLLLGLIVSLLSVRGKFPFTANIFKLFDRPRDAHFPGKGAFYFLLGVGLTFAFFEVQIAYASILILAVGDSLNHLFGERMPKQFNLPWNRRKSVFGVLLGIIWGVFAAQFFVPFVPALIATTIAIFLETIPWHIGKYYLDDNVLVPLIAGSVLFLLV
jgi:dolichol kinase